LSTFAEVIVKIKIVYFFETRSIRIANSKEVARSGNALNMLRR